MMFISIFLDGVVPFLILSRLRSGLIYHLMILSYLYSG